MSESHAQLPVLSDDQGSYPALTGMVPAVTGRRVAARIINVVVMAGLGLILYELTSVPLSYLAFLVIQILCWANKGNHLGGVMLGLVNVDVHTGQKAGGKAFLKYLVIDLVSGITFGIVPPIVCLVTVKGDTKRNAFDRMAGVVVINTAQGAGPRKPGATPVAIPAAPAPEPRRQIEEISLSGSQDAGSGAQEVQGVGAITQPKVIEAVPPTPSADSPAQSQPSFSDPFAASDTTEVSSPIQSINKPGAAGFIESTPFASSLPNRQSPTPEPPATSGYEAAAWARPTPPPVPVEESVPADFTPTVPPQQETGVQQEASSWAQPAPSPFVPTETGSLNASAANFFASPEAQQEKPSWAQATPPTPADASSPSVATPGHVAPQTPQAAFAQSAAMPEPQSSFGETVVDEAAFTPEEDEPVRQVWLNGQTLISLDRVTLIGRNPSPVPELPNTETLSLTDPEMKLSKTHLAIGSDGKNWWVMDLRSTNGTYLVAADGSSSKIESVILTPVPSGSVVRFSSHEIKA